MRGRDWLVRTVSRAGREVKLVGLGTWWDAAGIVEGNLFHWEGISGESWETHGWAFGAS